MEDQILVPTLDELVAEKCRRSFFYFVKEFWDVIIAEPPVYNWHIEYLCDELQQAVERVIRREPKEADIIINIPPGTTKSTIATVMLNAWAWANDPSLRFLSASYSASLSTDHAVKTRDIVRSERYRRYFLLELKKDQDGKTHYRNTQGGERFATSVTGSVTGFHAHIMAIDDPLNPNESLSEVKRESANDFMDTTLSTRKVDKSITLTILIMQRLHEEDCTGNWLKKKAKKIKHYCLPGEISDDVKPKHLKEKYKDGLLDPIRLNRGDLKGLKTDLGSYGYAGQIMQTPTPKGGGVWKEYIIPIKDKDFPTDLQQLGTDWDLAYTEKETNSASAFVTAGKKDNKMYIDRIGFKWKEFPDLISWMKLEKAPHYIEAKASGKSAKQTLTKNGIPAIEVDVIGGDKVARTRMATPYAEAQMVYCRESILDELYNDDKQGILKFPNTGDDLNDALVQSIQRLLRNPEMFFF